MKVASVVIFCCMRSCILIDRDFFVRVLDHQVVTILVGVDANIGAVRSIGVPLLKEALEPLCRTLLDSLAPPPASSS